MKVLFLGYAVSESQADLLSGASIAGNKMQLGLIWSLVQSPQAPRIDAVTVFPMAPFPKDRKICIRRACIDLGRSQRSRRVGFLNVPVLKQITQALAVTLEGVFLTRRNRYDCVLAYNMYPQVGIAAWLIGRLFHIPVVLLLADPPVEQDANRRGFSKILVGLFNGLTERLICTCGAVIVLNSSAAERYAPRAKRLVIDGAVDPGSVPTPVHRPANGGGTEKHVVFTGALASYNGIAEMIEAMQLIRSDDVLLEIYGDGPLADHVRDAASSTMNITYHGRVGSSTIARIHQEAFLLVNPRRIDDQISKVTFPSKMLEYMLSGTPVLTTRLNGFTSDYEGKVFFTKDDSARSIATAIDDLACRPISELQKTADDARAFVLATRSWAARGPEIASFLLSAIGRESAQNEH